MVTGVRVWSPLGRNRRAACIHIFVTRSRPSRSSWRYAFPCHGPASKPSTRKATPWLTFLVQIGSALSLELAFPGGGCPLAGANSKIATDSSKAVSTGTYSKDMSYFFMTGVGVKRRGAVTSDLRAACDQPSLLVQYGCRRLSRLLIPGSARSHPSDILQSGIFRSFMWKEGLVDYDTLRLRATSLCSRGSSTAL